MDKIIQKEVRIRRKLADIFNKAREDFETKEEYDDYIEQVEDYVFELVENEQNVEVNRKIEEYKAKYADEIAHNRAKKAEQQRQAAAAAAAATGAQADEQAQQDMPPSSARKLQHSILESLAVLDAVPAAGPAGDMPPMPTAPAQMNAEGSLVGGAVQSRDQHWRAARASGWTDDFPRKRNLQEAFGSLFVF